MAALLAGAGAQACINSYSLNLKAFRSQGNERLAGQMLGQIESDYRKSPDVKNTNDLAVARILYGRYDEAIELLRGLEQSHPGIAMTAANLGTALELKGDTAGALRWIRTGYERDHNEHDGSEWVHVKILEAKVALAKDATWLDTHSIMGLDFGADDQPRSPVFPIKDYTGRTHALGETKRDVGYQIFERSLFAKPPDRIMADMYLTIADLAFLEARPDSRNQGGGPYGLYQKALDYGHPARDLIERRIRRYDEALNAREIK
jgi:tetratricopeptide (TPR) repeat protein